VGVHLALLEKGTAFDVFTNEVCKAGPPILGGDELAYFKITWMASRGMIMRMGDDVVVKRTRVRDIDLILVGKETPIESALTCQSERRERKAGEIVPSRAWRALRMRILLLEAEEMR
jgi:hypothetical protein